MHIKAWEGMVWTTGFSEFYSEANIKASYLTSPRLFYSMQNENNDISMAGLPGEGDGVISARHQHSAQHTVTSQ